MRKLYLALAFSVFTNSALAATKYPNVTGDYWAELSYDTVTSFSDTDPNTNDGDGKSADFYLEANPTFRLNFNKNITLQTAWLLYNPKSPTFGDDRYLDDQGGVLEELFLKIHDEDAEFIIGRIRPEFGMLWDENLNTGIFGSFNGDEYLLEGKLGAGFKVKFSLEDYGNHILSFNSFFNDDTGLNDSFLSRRDTYRGDIGRAGDTSSFSSYAINLQGNNFYDVEGLFYNLSYRNVDAGSSSSGVDDEEGYALTLGITKPFLDQLNFTPIIEYAEIFNFNSTNNRFGPEFGDVNLQGDYEYLSIILALTYKNWSFNFNRLHKDFDADVNGGEDLTELSARYQFKNNLGLSLGTIDQDNSTGVERTTLAIQLDYSKNF